MNKNVLIVDDFASVRLYHQSFLTRKGYHCIGASNGEEALNKLREQPVDLILLDMVMPGMSGDAFITQLSANSAWAKIPVLAITSEEPLAQAAIGGSSRHFSVLAKPVMPDALLQRVQNLLALAAAPAVSTPLG